MISPPSMFDCLRNRMSLSYVGRIDSATFSCTVSTMIEELQNDLDFEAMIWLSAGDNLDVICELAVQIALLNP